MGIPDVSGRAVILPRIVARHVEDAALLAHQRRALVLAPHVRLHHLRRHDDRLAAHLDGVSVAGPAGLAMCEAALAEPGYGEMFCATAAALAADAPRALYKLLALSEAVPALAPGMAEALGWVSAQYLRATIRELLVSVSPCRRALAIAACALHQVDPGAALAQAVDAADVPLRACALRVAGECGRTDLVGRCLDALADDDAGCRFWAARSLLFLGQTERAMAVLDGFASEAAPLRADALALLLKHGAAAAVEAALHGLAADPNRLRLLVQGTGIAGDPYCVPWLIRQMHDAATARCAGEAFALITGLDLAWLDLDRPPPPDVQAEEPQDDAATGSDADLPWPDPVRINEWWQANQHRFQPGTRYFMGQPPTPDHCRAVLRDGYQRQRIAAAEYLCLLAPGSRLFPTAAPAWRQSRWLARMG